MSSAQEICNICLGNYKYLEHTDNTAEDNVKLITKLSSCIPELDCTQKYSLCQSCVAKLNLVYDFRELCLRSLKLLEDRGTRNDNTADSSDDDKCNTSIGDDVEDTKENVEIRTGLCNSLLNKKFKTSRSRDITRKLTNQNRKTTLDSTGCENGVHENQFDCNNELKTVQAELIKHEDIDLIQAKSRRSRKVLTKQIFQCNICTSKFSTKYLLARHVTNVHATEKRYSCDICGQKFVSPVYLSAHKRYHSGERPHICTTCGKRYITTSDLYHHQKIHANKRSYKCTKCPKAFNTSSDLHKHNICVHMDRSQWKYVCNFCDKRFPLKTNMDTHVKTHTGEKNFECHVCMKRFINKSVLIRHIVTHSNVRSYKCNVCSQEYKHKKSLDYHLTKAHAIGDVNILERKKRYICHICPKTYCANNKLQKHIRTHTGERPFGCSACEQKFIDKPCLNQHVKSVHSELVGILSNPC